MDGDSVANHSHPWRAKGGTMTPKQLTEHVAAKLWELGHESWKDCPCPDSWRAEAWKLILYICKRSEAVRKEEPTHD